MKTMKQARELLGITRPTLVDWCEKGLIRFKTKKRGMFKERFFSDSEIQRVRSMMQKREIGKPLFPR